MNAEEKCGHQLQIARAYVKHKAPYVSRILYGLVPHAAPGYGTLGVSKGMVLVIDPAWFITLTTNVQGGCLMHEISHILRGLDRLDAFPNHDLANLAFDLPINHDLRTANWELPGFANYPEDFGLPVGLTGEQYYELLDKKCKANDKKLIGHLGSARGVGAGKCGGCAGNPVVGEIESGLDRQKGRAQNDVQYIQQAAAKDIRKAQKEGSGRGNIPNTLLQWLPPEPEKRFVLISWKSKLDTVLRRATGQVRAGRADYSYRRLSRRSFMYGMVKPGMVTRLPTVAFAEDTSGSMGAPQIREGRIQAVDVFQQLGIQSAWWISSDAAVAAPPRILRMNEIRNMPIIGRGGTNFTPAIELATTLRPKPDILIYLTDGDGFAPQFPPANMEVVFCIVPSPYINREPAPWSINIVLEDELVAA